MDIQWLRDLIICIYGIIGILLCIFILVIGVILYKKITIILNSVKTTTERIDNIVISVKQNVVEPVLSITAFLQGIKQILNSITNLFRKSEVGRYE